MPLNVVKENGRTVQAQRYDAMSQGKNRVCGLGLEKQGKRNLFVIMTKYMRTNVKCVMRDMKNEKEHRSRGGLL